MQRSSVARGRELNLCASVHILGIRPNIRL
jgi:hypothetical protein